MRHLRFPSLRLALGLAAAVVSATAALAQGSLTPPGAPGPTMKTLDQIEPRIPLVAGSPGVVVNAQGGITIEVGGSYYLTRNLSVAAGNGITVDAAASGNVTIDLMGFSISSELLSRGGTAIAYSATFSKETAEPNIVIRHGHIRLGYLQSGTPAGFQNGIIAPAIVENIVINDALQTGISALIVRQCKVRAATLTAIDAVEVIDSSVDEFSLFGINASARATNCTVRDFAGSGTTAINAPLVENCVVRFIYDSSQVRNARGILATIAKNCYVSGPVSTGIEATLAVGCATFGVVGNTIASKQDMP